MSTFNNCAVSIKKKREVEYVQKMYLIQLTSYLINLFLRQKFIVLVILPTYNLQQRYPNQGHNIVRKTALIGVNKNLTLGMNLRVLASDPCSMTFCLFKYCERLNSIFFLSLTNSLLRKNI
jgi:hypothetical protein